MRSLILVSILLAFALPSDASPFGHSREDRADARLRLHGEWVAQRREAAREAWRLCQSNPELRSKALPLCLEHPRKPPASQYGPAAPYMEGTSFYPAPGHTGQ
ncbi:hypothetical protein QQM79_03340 [Marinobacteraceae bacterium S3BR75-40.1]